MYFKGLNYHDFGWIIMNYPIILSCICSKIYMFEKLYIFILNYVSNLNAEYAVTYSFNSTYST